MPMFKVLRRVDAWIDYVAEIEADNPSEAAHVAHDRDSLAGWKRVGEAEFWNARFTTLDPLGEEMSDTLVTRG